MLGMTAFVALIVLAMPYTPVADVIGFTARPCLFGCYDRDCSDLLRQRRGGQTMVLPAICDVMLA